MAFINTQFCRQCGKETMHCNSKCTACRDSEYRQQVAAWNEKSLDQKLNNLRQRLEELERGPAKY